MLKVDWVQFTRGFLAVMTVTALALWGPEYLQANQALVITVGFEMVFETFGMSVFLLALFHWQWCWLQVMLLVDIAILRRLEDDGATDEGVLAYKGCFIFAIVFLTTYFVPDQMTRQWIRMYIALYGITTSSSTSFKSLGFNIGQSLTGMAISIAVGALPLPTLATDMWKETLLSLLQSVDKRQRGLISVFKAQKDQVLTIEKAMKSEEHVKKQLDGLTAKLPVYGMVAPFEIVLTDPTFGPKAPIVAGFVQSLEVQFQSIVLNLQKLGTMKDEDFQFDPRLGESLEKMSALISCMLLEMCKTVKGDGGYWNINLFYTQDFSKLTDSFGDGAAEKKGATMGELSTELQEEAKAFWELLEAVLANCMGAKDDSNNDEETKRAALHKSGLHPLLTASYFNLLRIVALTDQSAKTLEQVPPRSKKDAYKAAFATFWAAMKKLIKGQFYLFNDGMATARLVLAFRVSLAVGIGTLWALVDGLINGLGGSFGTRGYWVPFTVAAIWLDDSSAMPKRGVERIFGTFAGVTMGQLWAFYMGNYEWSMQVWMIAVYAVDRLVFMTWDGHTYMAGAYRYAFLFATFGGIEAVPDDVDLNSPEARSTIIETLEDRVFLTAYGVAIAVIISLTVFPSRASERFYTKSVTLTETWSSMLDLMMTKLETNDALSEDDTKTLAGLHSKAGGLLKGQQADAALAEQDWILWYTPFEGVSAQNLLEKGKAFEIGLVLMENSLTADAVGLLKANEDLHHKLVKSMLSLREAVDHLGEVASGSLGQEAKLVDFTKMADMRNAVEEFITAAEVAGLRDVAGENSEGVSTKELAAFDAFAIGFMSAAKITETFAVMLEDRTDQAYDKNHYSLTSAMCGPCGAVEVKSM